MCTHACATVFPFRVDERPPIDYISFIHKELLSKICTESDFKGLAYYGGPEVMCEKCDRMVLLPCVEYDVMSGVEEEPKITPKCEGCGTKYDVNKLLVCAIHIIVVCIDHNYLHVGPNSC